MTSTLFTLALFSLPLIGVTLNGSIILSLLRKKQMNKIANIFFFNQALADVLFLSLLPFISLEFYLQDWPFGEMSCQTLIVLDSMNQFSSVFLLTVMSVDRYFCLSRPLTRMQFRTKNYAWLLSLATWILSCLLCCPLWFFSQSYGSPEDAESDASEKCYFLESEDSNSANQYKVFTLYAFTVGFLAPLLVISVANYSILGHINRSSKSKAADSYQPRIHTPNQNSDNEKRKKTCVIVVICTVIFAVCWLPLYLFLIHVYFFASNQTEVQSTTQLPSSYIDSNSTTITLVSGQLEIMETDQAPLDTTNDTIRMACLLLSYCNGMLNPLVLLVMSSSVRANIPFFCSRSSTSPNSHSHRNQRPTVKDPRKDSASATTVQKIRGTAKESSRVINQFNIEDDANQKKKSSYV